MYIKPVTKTYVEWYDDQKREWVQREVAGWGAGNHADYLEMAPNYSHGSQKVMREDIRKVSLAK